MVDISFFIGQSFGHSLVIAQEGADDFGLPTWRCRCDRCGRERVASTNPIIKRFPTPCGCSPPRRSATPRRSRGGLSRTRAYRVWADLRRRCRGDRDRGDYRRRGFELHSSWGEFEVFMQDVGPAPGHRASLERLDRSRGYEPGNVRWTVAAVTRLNARMITIGDRTMSLTEWANEAGLRPSTLAWRLDAGWNVERALATRPKR